MKNAKLEIIVEHVAGTIGKGTSGAAVKVQAEGESTDIERLLAAAFVANPMILILIYRAVARMDEIDTCERVDFSHMDKDLGL